MLTLLSITPVYSQVQSQEGGPHLAAAVVKFFWMMLLALETSKIYSTAHTVGEELVTVDITKMLESSAPNVCCLVSYSVIR